MIIQNNLLERITVNPAICHGKPAIRNKRYTVESILEYMAGGDSTEDLLKEFTDLEKDDILACLTFAMAMLKEKTVNITDNEVYA